MVSVNFFLQLATYLLGYLIVLLKSVFSLCQIITSQQDFDKMQVYLIIEQIVQATVGNNIFF